MKQQILEKDWEDTHKILYKKVILYIPMVIRTKVICRHHDDLLTEHFEINKAGKLIA